jgi:hypothetical protein
MEKPQKQTELLKCDLPPREALRRAMLVQPPDDWKKARRHARKGTQRGKSSHRKSR